MAAGKFAVFVVMTGFAVVSFTGCGGDDVAEIAPVVDAGSDRSTSRDTGTPRSDVATGGDQSNPEVTPADTQSETTPGDGGTSVPPSRRIAAVSASTRLPMRAIAATARPHAQ